MKLTAILLFAACLQVSAKGYSQITLSESNTPLKKVFKKIQKQSGYDFLCTYDLLQQAGNVTVQVNNASLPDVLKEILKGKGLTYTMVEKTIVIKKDVKQTKEKEENIQAPFIEIKGKITDDTGRPLPGVSVVVRGTTKGTSTNANGEFSIDANAGEVLEFSFVGYKKQSITVGNNTVLNIKMEIEVIVGNEIVVVGYGTQKKANLTGAVDQVSKEVLENRPITRISQALQGVVGNLNILSNGTGGAPNATQSINIRGYTGFGSRGAPLLVIDGIPGGDINTINPNDVESISVLKDQASAAIYGVDGAFGVILINTKQGKKGRAPQITYDNNISYSQLMNIPNPVGSLEYVTIWNEAALNAGSTAIYPAEQIQRIKDYLAGTLKTETQANIAGTDWINGQLGNANNNWFDILFKNWGVNQQHNMGISGGASNVTYYVGLGYNHKQGMYSYGNDDFKTYNLRANLGLDVTSWMKFNLRSSFARTNADNPFDYPARTGGGLGGYMHQAARVAPVVPRFNPDGNLANFSDPVYMGSGSRTIDNNDQTFLTGEFVLNPLKGWNITANYTLNSFNAESSSLGKTIYIPRPDGSLATFGLNPNTFSRSFGKTSNHLVNLFTSYEKSLGNHNFKVLGGYIRRFNESLFLSANNSNLYTDNLPSLSLTYNDKPIISDAIGQFATEGYFTRLNYNYKDKYLLEFDGRYDATSRFLNNRWQFYPGVSAGYIISKENFWKPLEKVVNTFKLRTSYGASGDQGSLGLYPFYESLGTQIAANTNWFFGSGRQASVSAPGVINPNITWQKPVMLDLGVDASFLSNRLTVTFDWYKRTMKDLSVASAPLPAVFGTAAPSANNGEMETKGFELTTGWNDRIGQLKYGIRAVLSDYKGKVTKYPNPTKILSDYYVGANIGEIWGYTSTGLYADNLAASTATPATFWGSTWKGGDVIYTDLDKSGRIDIGKNTADSSGDLRVIGNTTPRYAYSFALDLEWKGFDLNIFLQGVAKRDLWVDNNYFWGITGDRFQSSFFDIHRDRWTTDNPNGYYPKYYMSGEMNKNTRVQTRYLQNGAYLRLKNVQLGYSLPANLIKRWHLNKVRIYGSAENLATITKMAKSVDPELAAADAGRGVGKVYPLQRTFSFGVNIGL
ncbi:TonB-dependent receptor [Ferruginibacter sp.]|nr:TonB-dependent receptor [Ferruginibacter sp.]